MQFQLHEIIPYLAQYTCFYGDACSLLFVIVLVWVVVGFVSVFLFF